MKSSVQISRGIEALFGTRDENIRLLEDALGIRTRLLNDSLEIEGEEEAVRRATEILADYAALVREGHVFHNGDLILFVKYSGSDIKIDGNEYLIMREDEVLGVLEGGSKKAKA